MLPLIGAIHDENEANQLTIDEAFECFMEAVSGGARYGLRLDYSTTTSNPDQLFGSHNGVMNNCIFLNLAEAEWAKYKRYSNRLRDLFTIRVITIDEKFMPSIKQNNFTRIIIDGSAERIMYVSRTARRLSIYTVNPVYMGDTKYFGEFTDAMNNGGREALMYFFLNRKIGGFFDPFKPLYTEELDEQKELSLDAVSEFWLEEYLEKGVLPYEEIVTGIDGRSSISQGYC
jgi:hypothetical protein